MKGLLLKDAYQTWCYIRWIILVSIAMMLVGTFFMKEGSNFFMLYGGLLLGMSPMTLLAYDQNSRFGADSAALPVQALCDTGFSVQEPLSGRRWSAA